MNTNRIDIERSARSSRLRVRVLVALAELEVAHAGELATACRISTNTLRRLMHGAPPEYSIELAPLSLGLATVVAHPIVEAYAITDLGRAWVKGGRHAARRAREATSALA